MFRANDSNPRGTTTGRRLGVEWESISLGKKNPRKGGKKGCFHQSNGSKDDQSFSESLNGERGIEG